MLINSLCHLNCHFAHLLIQLGSCTSYKTGRIDLIPRCRWWIIWCNTHAVSANLVEVRRDDLQHTNYILLAV